MPCRVARVLCKLKSRNCWKVSNNDTYAFVHSHLHVYISACFSRALVASIVLFFLDCAIDWEWCWNNHKSTKELRQFHLPYGMRMYEYGKFNVHAWISPAYGIQHTARTHTCEVCAFTCGTLDLHTGNPTEWSIRWSTHMEFTWRRNREKKTATSFWKTIKNR